MSGGVGEAIVFYVLETWQRESAIGDILSMRLMGRICMVLGHFHVMAIIPVYTHLPGKFLLLIVPTHRTSWQRNSGQRFCLDINVSDGPQHWKHVDWKGEARFEIYKVESQSVDNSCKPYVSYMVETWQKFPQLGKIPKYACDITINKKNKFLPAMLEERHLSLCYFH